MDTEERRVRSSVGRRLRRYFLTGLVVLAPVGLTIACLHVFVPTLPNPTSGSMLVVPVDRVKNVDMSVEDAMKLVISGGALKPGATVVGRKGLDLETLLRDTLG